MRCKLLVLLICLCSCQTENDLPIIIDLNSDWEFRQSTDSVWYSTKVPGNIYSDLLCHELINDPFIKDNEDEVQWVSRKDWEYKTIFLLDHKVLSKKHIQLNFEGLDTYASVFLNDSLILKANNAFRRWNVNVQSIIKAENELRIVFEATSKFEEKEKAKLPYELPEGNRVFTRKAQFQYGWDWAPKLNVSGIWRPITLLAWSDYHMTDLYVETTRISELDAALTIKIEKLSSIPLDQELIYDIYVNDSLYKSSTEIQKGAIWMTDLKIQNPKLWWPHNIGDPHLYDIKVVARRDNQILDSLSVKHGIRKIELVTEKDSLGESFYFKINAKPVYAKGANYIPQHSFQNRVEDNHYEKLLNDVVGANMNMLRVWGGGIYENDTFYQVCDEKGILVWQDFMFACAMYPGDEAFLENVSQEAIDNIKRLRKHASIALWCGNNEISEGWHRWGWQSGRSEEEKEEIWSNYQNVFDSILPKAVERYTDTDYWESSPKFGRGNPKYHTEGDAHDWWIWHDAYPFEHLEEQVPRFMSEFGFQAFPSFEVLRHISQTDFLDISSSEFKNHQKHVRGFQLINEYMQRDFPVPDNTDDYVYVSQLLQAYGVTKGIEAQRRAKPYNMGTLYWQLNDCWPAVSWSSIDFFGNWKALHYKLKSSFKNILASSKVEDGLLTTWLVNDNAYPVTDTLYMKIIDFEGNHIWENIQSLSLDAETSKSVFKSSMDAIKFDKDKAVLITEFHGERSFFYFTRPKFLKLNSSSVRSKITKVDSGFEIELYAETFQKDVFLFTKEKGHFSDNFFDLAPMQTMKIHFQTKAKHLQNLNVKTLNDLIDNR